MRTRQSHPRREAMGYNFGFAIETFVRVFLTAYAKFDGRTGRREFWHFCSIVAILAFVAVLPGWIVPVFEIADRLVWLGVLTPTAAIGVRRMHDTGRTGKWLLVPGYNLVLACRPGQLGPNRFGPDPRGATLDAFA